MKNNYIFESDRLGFRFWENEDIKFYTDLCSNPKVMQFFPKLLSIKEAQGEMYYLDDLLRTNGFGFWAVELKETQELIGDIGIQKVPFKEFFTPSLEIGWRISSPYWRQGLALEGALRVLEFAKTNQLCTDIVAYTSSKNTPSLGLIHKLGMIYTGEFPYPLLPLDHPLSLQKVYQLKLF